MKPAKTDPDKFDLVMRDNDFVIYYDRQPLLTPCGKEFSHFDSRLLRHLLIRFSLSERMNTYEAGSTGVFSFCRDVIEPGKDLFQVNITREAENDPLFRAKFVSGIKMYHPPEGLLENLDDKMHIINLMLLGSTVISKSLNDFFSTLDEMAGFSMNSDANRKQAGEFISYTYQKMSNEQKAALQVLSASHQSGILLPAMLIKSVISPSEYALSAMANQKGAALAETQTPWWKQPGERFFKIYREALDVMEFLDFFRTPGKQMSVINTLISQGEGETIEFKSTLRWDLRQNKKNPAIEHAVLKTICAFLNSSGGDLLIGVADDGAIAGIEADNFANTDKFLLHLWTLIKTSIGKDASDYIATSLEKINTKTVCRVRCKPGREPFFLKQPGFGELFYIRIGPGSGNLDISEALKYIASHFSK